MVSVSCDIDQAAVGKLDDLLVRVQRETPKRLATETRRAAIYICQSLRSRTKKAPKQARPREMRAEPSLKRPRYQFYFGKKDKEGGRSGKRDKPLRRWSLTRKFGTPDAYTKHHYVYTNAHRAKNGKMVGKATAAERRELIKLHGGISRAGLAKLSWGWIMKQIYNNAAVGDVSWKRVKGERRDPRRYVKGLFARAANTASAQITNGLDYILDALRPGALAEAVNAAAMRLEYNILNNVEKVAS